LGQDRDKKLGETREETEEQSQSLNVLAKGCEINCVNGHRDVKLFYERELLNRPSWGLRKTSLAG